jgi:hypothetical protein
MLIERTLDAIVWNNLRLAERLEGVLVEVGDSNACSELQLTKMGIERYR